jgi:hypothetical protein
LACLLAGKTFAAAGSCQQVEAEAGHWLDNGDPRTAAGLLSAQEADCAGQEAFDHLLGFALLNSGQNEAASWVLERAVAANPDNGAAWLDLADAYLRLGEQKRAQEALQHASALQPPEAAREKISLLQDRLHSMSSVLSSNGYLALEQGYDSNVNSATDLSTISAPGISPLPIRLDPDSRQASSPYRDAELGEMLSWRVTPTLTLYTQAHVKYRSYTELSEFNRGIVGWQGGAGQQVGAGMLFDMVQLEHQTVGGHSYLHSVGDSLEWRLPLSTTRMMSVMTQYLATHYDTPAMRGYDSDEILLGLTFTQALWSNRLSWQLAGYRGQDNATNNRAGGNRRLIILSSALDYHFSQSCDFNLAVTHESDDYSNTDPAFLLAHQESVWNYTADFNWPFTKQQTLTVSYSYIRDIANIPLYSSTRQVLGTGWRFNF